MQPNSSIRRFVVGLLICLLPLPLEAQGPSGDKRVRVRITGPDTYEVPGVIRIEREHIQGHPAKLTDGFVQFARPDDRQLLTIPRPRQRLTGKVLAIADGLLEFVPDDETKVLYVPVDAITKIEIGSDFGSRSDSFISGIAAGLGASWVTRAAYEKVCTGDDCGYSMTALVVSAVAGIIVGLAVSDRLHGQRWDVVSIDALSALLGQSSNPTALSV